MAASTPVIVQPVASEAGIRPDDLLMCVKQTYQGASTQRECRWQISATNSFPASGSNLLFDSLLREDDSLGQGDDWIEIQCSLIPLAIGTTYYLSCLVRNGSNESSSWATGVAFTTTTGLLTAATWRQAH